MRVTLGDIQNEMPDGLGDCPTSARFIRYVNQATRRLLRKGHWWGTYAKFNICATDGCITMPPQIATIETAAICHRPVPVHDLWFEFIESGAGTRNQCSCWGEANYRGRFPIFTDVTGTDKKLKLVCDVSQDVGKTALVLGYDQNGNWIRTIQNGVYADGEVIAMAQGSGTTSVNLFTSVTDIQLPSARSGQCWLYTVSQTDASLIMIGHYQAFETRPSYARYFFPTVQNLSSTGGTCTTRLVEIIAKLEFIPVVNPNDYCIIGNIDALREMMLGIRESELEPDRQKSLGILTLAETVAVKLLDDELDHYLGSGRRIGIDFVGSSIGQICPIETLL